MHTTVNLAQHGPRLVDVTVTVGAVPVTIMTPCAQG
jgi:hypothetical protein